MGQVRKLRHSEGQGFHQGYSASWQNPSPFPNGRVSDHTRGEGHMPCHHLRLRASFRESQEDCEMLPSSLGLAET